jgi:hypothetical protein
MGARGGPGDVAEAVGFEEFFHAEYLGLVRAQELAQATRLLP